MIYKTSFCLAFLFLSLSLFSQKKYSLSLQIKQGITGLEKTEQYPSNFYDFERTVFPGGDFSVGVDFEYSFFKRKILSLSGGLLWNYNSFTRKEEIINSKSTTIPIPELVNTYRFQSHSVTFPLSINTRIKKIGFSLGMIPRYHLSTKLGIDHVSTISGLPEGYQELSIIYQSGKKSPNSPFNQGYAANVFLQTKMDVQILMGINFFLNDQLSIELEYKNIIDVNYLEIEVDVPNGINHPLNHNYDFNSRAVTVGLNWKIF